MFLILIQIELMCLLNLCSKDMLMFLTIPFLKRFGHLCGFCSCDLVSAISWILVNSKALGKFISASTHFNLENTLDEVLQDSFNSKSGCFLQNLHLRPYRSSRSFFMCLHILPFTFHGYIVVTADLSLT